MPVGVGLGRVTTTPALELQLIGMTAVERLSQLSTIELEVVSRDGPVDLHPVLSKAVGVSFGGGPHQARDFHGILVEYAELGRLEDSRDFAYRMVVRPRQYLLGLNRRSMIHHNKTMADLLALLGDDKQPNLAGSYPAVEYRVQHDESDWAFVCRHLEREGIYYFFDHGASAAKIALVDAPAGHAALEPAAVRLGGGAPLSEGDEALLTSLHEHRRFAPTGYAVDDYDYVAPTASLRKTKQTATLGKRPARFADAAPADVAGTIAERVEHPGNYAQASLATGERYAAVRLEADRAEMARSYADGNLFAAAVGRTLTVKFDEADAEFGFQAEQKHLIVGTRHVYQQSGYRSGAAEDEVMRVELELMPADHPFRPPLLTPMPRIRGPQTGVVVGPAGKEVYTDKYGRIRVRFFWDGTTPAADPHARSIWVRVAQMSAGNGWGAFMVPRIGHEVIIEYLNGDPDRPIVTGSVYNETNLPAFGTGEENPVQGIRTNSSKGGGGFNEIRLDDTKDAEVFSVQAQKDLKTLVLKGDETRDIKEGSRTTTIDKGDETLSVKTGKRTVTIKADETLTVEQGNVATTLKQGNETRKLDMGNRDTKFAMGNDSTKLDLGKSDTEAMQSIEFKVGQSSIKIDQMGVTIKGMTIKIEAQLMFETKGLMMQQQASAMHVVKGGIVMIN